MHKGTLLHERSLMHEVIFLHKDTFAWRQFRTRGHFWQRHLCTKSLLHGLDILKNIFSFLLIWIFYLEHFIFTIAVAPYPRSVSFFFFFVFLLIYFLSLFVFFLVIEFFLPLWKMSLRQKCLRANLTRSPAVLE